MRLKSLLEKLKIRHPQTGDENPRVLISYTSSLCGKQKQWLKPAAVSITKSRDGDLVIVLEGQHQ